MAPSAIEVNNESSPGPVICVFCGACKGDSPHHQDVARALALEFHKNSISLVYGGGTVGMMGELARTLVSLSGPSAVHGVIPEAIMKHETDYDPANGTYTEEAVDEATYGKTTVVKDMHTRKKMMCSMVEKGGPGSGFIALSGGFGTLEELMEMVTWNQLKIHNKGVCVLNTNGYWDGILQWIKTAVGDGFIAKENGAILKEARGAEEVVAILMNYKNSKDRPDLSWEDA